MSFIEKLEGAFEELGNELKDGGTMILIASEGRSLDGSLCYIKGNKTTAAILLANCANQNNDLKRIYPKSLTTLCQRPKISVTATDTPFWMR